MPKVSIIIVSYNTEQLIDECIASIYSSENNFSYEIIVVDNNSTDCTVKKLSEKYPDIIIIKNTENLKFAKANNQAASIAKGDYLLLLNSDTIVYQKNISKLVYFMENLPEYIICTGPKILNNDLSLQSSGYPLPSVCERITMSFKLYKYLPYPLNSILLPMGTPSKKGKSRKVGWVSGSCMLMRKKQYLEIGGLNETMDFYGEEPEFGFRSHKNGYSTMYFPDAEIIHLGGASTNSSSSEELRLSRYSALQRETVGYKRAILMSKIVIFACYIKFIVSRNPYFKNALTYEKKVVSYLQEMHEKTTHRR